MALHYGLAEYYDGDRIVDLPVMEGASWSVGLNVADELSCDIDLRDGDVRALDIPSVTEPKKTVLFVANDDGVVLAWGVISEREWNDDERTMHIEASGGWQYFHQRIIAPPGAATGIIVDGAGYVTTTYDTTINDVTLGTIGKRLVEQALSWPGAPTAFVLPADVADPGRTSGTYKLVDYKSVGEALDDLVRRENGPDFAFDARIDSTGLRLEYPMRIGEPFLGSYVGSWAVGSQRSPVTGLKVTDDGLNIATHIWMQSGRTDSKVLVARARNDDLITAAGYPPLDYVDTSRTDVVLQPTLDDYAAEHRERRRRAGRTLKFSVKGNTIDLDGSNNGPSVGQYRPGDWLDLDVAPGNLYLDEGSIPIRIVGMSGDETGETIDLDVDLGVSS